MLTALIVALTLASSMAAYATDVTVTATPSYVSFSSAPTSWGLNNITGDGYVDVDTIYYANPLGDTTAPSATVADADCQFTWTNGSSVNITITVNCGNFTSGDADMTNSGTGANGATSYGGYSWYSGGNYTATRQIMKETGSTALYTTTTPGEDKKWGAQIETQTDAWTGGTGSTTTMTITAVAA